MRHIEYIGARPIFLDQCGTEMMGSVPQFPWKLKGTFLKIAGEEGGGGRQGTKVSEQRMCNQKN